MKDNKTEPEIFHNALIKEAAAKPKSVQPTALPTNDWKAVTHRNKRIPDNAVPDTTDPVISDNALPTPAKKKKKKKSKTADSIPIPGEDISETAISLNTCNDSKPALSESNKFPILDTAPKKEKDKNFETKVDSSNITVSSNSDKIQSAKVNDEWQIVNKKVKNTSLANKTQASETSANSKGLDKNKKE